MYDIIGLLETITNTYFTDVTFVHGNKETANIDVRNINESFVFFERPYTISAQQNENNVIAGTYSINLIFAMPNKYFGVGDSSTNGYQNAIDSSYIEPAQTMMMSFLSALQNHSDINGLVNFKAIDLTDWEEFDNNASGVFCMVTFTVRNIGNFCSAPAIPEENIPN